MFSNSVALPRGWFWSLLLWVGALACGVGPAMAQSSAPTNESDASGERVSRKIVVDEPPAIDRKHPLEPILKFARDTQRYVEQSVRTYSCRLVKREQINGRIGDYQYADLRVRERQGDGGQMSDPLAVYVEFLAPATVAGRRVLYVGDQNDNKMLVRRGGKRFSYVVVSLDPHGPSAQHESRVPITDVDYRGLIAGLIQVIDRHIRVDPAGVNTQVQVAAQAKVDGRPCSVIRVIHPAPQDGIGFYTASVYIDQKLHVPIRIDAYGWPESPDQAPPLMAEYTYTDLKLNVDLPADTFHADAVRSR